MPFAQIDLIEGRTEEQRRAVIEKVTDALVEAVGAPGRWVRCTGDLCLARHPSGQVVVQPKTEMAAKPACAFASVVIIDDATASDPCRRPSVTVITKRQLARSGSAEIFLSVDPDSSRARTRFAVEADYRPWHVQRQFSREARGMEPYQRKDPNLQARSEASQ